MPLDALAARYKFEPPRKTGLNTVEACEQMISGKVKALLSLGGKFVRAVPEREAMEQAWSCWRPGANGRRKTEDGKARIISTQSLSEDADMPDDDQQQ